MFFHCIHSLEDFFLSFMCRKYAPFPHHSTIFRLQLARPLRTERSVVAFNAAVETGDVEVGDGAYGILQLDLVEFLLFDFWFLAVGGFVAGLAALVADDLFG